MIHVPKQQHIHRSSTARATAGLNLVRLQFGVSVFNGNDDQGKPLPLATERESGMIFKSIPWCVQSLQVISIPVVTGRYSLAKRNKTAKTEIQKKNNYDLQKKILHRLKKTQPLS
jgi:hypothetical protein